MSGLTVLSNAFFGLMTQTQSMPVAAVTCGLDGKCELVWCTVVLYVIGFEWDAACSMRIGA